MFQKLERSNNGLVTYIKKEVVGTINNEAIMQRFQNMKTHRMQFVESWIVM